MTALWVACLPRERVAALGAVRLLDWEVLEEGDLLFVRGKAPSVPKEALSLPGTLFRALPDGQLVELRRRTPTARMPGGAWQSLRSWWETRLPPLGWQATLSRTVPLRVVRRERLSPRQPVSQPSSRAEDPEATPAAVLLTSFAIWEAYVQTAAQTRLRRLRFAADLDGRVVLHGAPLPPLKGRRFVERCGVAVEAGCVWSPPVAAEVVAAAARLQPGDLLLLSLDEAAERIVADDFVAASRSAVRATSAHVSKRRPSTAEGDVVTGPPGDTP